GTEVSWNSRHDVDAAVDIHGGAGEAPRVRRGQIRAGEADVHDVHEIAERGALAGFVEQQVEVPEAGGRARLHRTGRDRVNADVLGPQLVGEVAARGLERRLHRAHHVVVRHDLLRAVIAP